MLPGSFSTRESKNRKPNLTGAAAWEANKTRAATEEVSNQAQFKSKKERVKKERKKERKKEDSAGRTMGGVGRRQAHAE